MSLFLCGSAFAGRKARFWHLSRRSTGYARIWRYAAALSQSRFWGVWPALSGKSWVGLAARAANWLKGISYLFTPAERIVAKARCRHLRKPDLISVSLLCWICCRGRKLLISPAAVCLTRSTPGGRLMIVPIVWAFA